SGDRILALFVPALGVDAGEQIQGVGVPRPAQVAGELPQRADRLWQDGADAEPTDGLHLSDHRRRLASIQRNASCPGAALGTSNLGLVTSSPLPPTVPL